MRIRRWWNGLSFKRQVFLLMAAAIVATVLVVEMGLEPMVEGKFNFDDWDVDWYEVPSWATGALILGLAGSAIITRTIMVRLDRLAGVTDRIAHGDLSARMPVGDNPHDEFNRLGRRFNMMADTIERLLTNEQRLLSDISHELRSPLARIGAAIELMSLKDAGNGNAAHLRRIEDNVQHMNHLVGVLLEQGRNRLSLREGREAVDVSALAVELTEGYRMQGEALKKNLLAGIVPGLRVEGHPLQLRIIVENILGNAMFYAPDNTNIELSLAQERGNAVLIVRDRGPGVPEDKLGEIFKPFYRVDASRARKSGGIGLGLTLVEEACMALGGSVRAENACPGLRMTVTLPLSDRMPAAGAETDFVNRL